MLLDIVASPGSPASHSRDWDKSPVSGPQSPPLSALQKIESLPRLPNQLSNGDENKAPQVLAAFILRVV